MIGEISRDEVRSAIEDKLCAHFGVSGTAATDDQIFQATAIVIRELMSRFLSAEDPHRAEKESTRKSTICPWSFSWAGAS